MVFSDGLEPGADESTELLVLVNAQDLSTRTQ